MLFNGLNLIIIPYRQIRVTVSCIVFGMIIVYFILYRKSNEVNVKFSFISDISRPPLTIECNRGRLGNQMNSYSILHGLARMNNRTPYMLPCKNMKILKKYFNLSMKTANNKVFKKYIAYEITNHLREKDCSIPNKFNKLTGEIYAHSHTFYDKYRDEIRREFTFKSHYREYTGKILNEAKKINNAKVFVGVHVRRGDYDYILKKYHRKKVDVQYFVEAINYFRKYQDMVFVVVSDDRKWCINMLGNFSDVYITPEPSDPGYDMAILAQCNHTIMTYGTFSYWGAYLAGGEAVYFANHLTPDSKFVINPDSYYDNFLPNWIGIGPGFIING